MRDQVVNKRLSVLLWNVFGNLQADHKIESTAKRKWLRKVGCVK
jgi:hypothetical protein